MSHPQASPPVVTCPRCGRSYRLPAGKNFSPQASLRCTACRNIFRLEAGLPVRKNPPKGRILVATDGAELRGILESVLLEGGYQAETAADGDRAWREVVEWRPEVALLDVSLPGMPVFEICDRVRGDESLGRTGLILVASVFRHTRYKRSPTSLYGADDYIEKHHIRDSLLLKIAKLNPTAGEALPAREIPAQEQAKKEEAILEREEMYGAARERPAAEGPEQSALRRFARIIVSDIALYNEEQVERGIREGTLHSLLEKELEEGRRLYETRLKPGAGAEKDFFRQAVEEFVARRRKSFRNPG